MSKKNMKVKKIINQIMEKENLDYSSARTELHKFVCGGSCNWYKSRNPSERFDKDDLAGQRKQNVQKIGGNVMKSATKDEARKEIHAVLCHPIS